MAVPTDAQLSEWRTLTDSASEGPWGWRYMSTGEAIVEQVDVEEAHLVAELGSCKDHPGMQGHDAEFIAAARAAVPQLLDEVERLSAQLAELRDVAEARGNLHANAERMLTEARTQGEEWRKALTNLALDITCLQCGPIMAEDVHLLAASSPHGEERCGQCGSGVEIRERNALAELNEAARVRAELEATEKVLEDLRCRRDALLARCLPAAEPGKVRLLDCVEIQSAFYNPLPGERRNIVADGPGPDWPATEPTCRLCGDAIAEVGGKWLHDQPGQEDYDHDAVPSTSDTRTDS